MAIGYLLIQARTAHEALPISGVQVKVLDSHGNSVYELTTDESGESQKVPLETLDKSFSQNPYYSGVPFTSYNVLAQKAGFDSFYISDIPIYDGETAVLPLSFVPMQALQRRPIQTDITIGKPAVASQEQRSQEGIVPPASDPLGQQNAINPAPGPLGQQNAINPATGALGQQNQEGNASGSRILRQVVIPNPITVHLGTPTSSAQNVQVSFPDYVKNVASSEIYPTWPDASLRSNIYAIISFALNRVFTEWYRSRGYNFDITNSTAYDQAFLYGRPIYDSISEIVDEIFNEYVRRQGQDAPYFTSFCNGTTVTCRGLSQWGTVTLANQGFTPLQILRNYYPDDIEIAETNTITGILSSYPGTLLQTGSTGLDVQTIQTYLNRIRQNYPAIPAITDETGVFQDSTKAAVTKFQSIFGLTPDGIVGMATWYKISSIYAGITRLAELDSEGTSLGIGTVPPQSVLRQGSSGQDVITLQYLLNVISEYYPGIPPLAQDGIFGSGTRQSVIAFQQAAGLQNDGIVGPYTWSALYDIYQGIQQNVPSPGTGTGTGTIEYTVKPGDSLWLISRQYGTTVDAIKRLNNLTSDLLSIGQVLKIPVSQTTPSYIEYTVRAGDTLWLLSRRYGTTVDAIMSLNGLTSDALSIGQVLRIPA